MDKHYRVTGSAYYHLIMRDEKVFLIREEVWAGSPEAAIEKVTEQLSQGHELGIFVDWQNYPAVSEISEAEKMRKMGIPTLFDLDQ